ncbi:MAG: hypothetical protein IJQ73_14570, partial [Kiritimatiellae bacterium]|nr:hypothetical protein [Kiritimatiellia bacterium]
RATATAPAQATAPAATPVQADDGAIRYFDDDDILSLTPEQVIGPQRQTQPQAARPAEASVPVRIGNTSSDWAIPME